MNDMTWYGKGQTHGFLNKWLSGFTCTVIPLELLEGCDLYTITCRTAQSNLFIALWFFTLFCHPFFITREKMTHSVQGSYVFINTAYWAWPVFCSEEFIEKCLIVIVAICIKYRSRSLRHVHSFQSIISFTYIFHPHLLFHLRNPFFYLVPWNCHKRGKF